MGLGVIVEVERAVLGGWGGWGRGRGWFGGLWVWVWWREAWCKGRDGRGGGIGIRRVSGEGMGLGENKMGGCLTIRETNKQSWEEAGWSFWRNGEEERDEILGLGEKAFFMHCRPVSFARVYQGMIGRLPGWLNDTELYLFAHFSYLFYIASTPRNISYFQC